MVEVQTWAKEHGICRQQSFFLSGKECSGFRGGCQLHPVPKWWLRLMKTYCYSICTWHMFMYVHDVEPSPLRTLLFCLFSSKNWEFHGSSQVRWSYAASPTGSFQPEACLSLCFLAAFLTRHPASCSRDPFHSKAECDRAARVLVDAAICCRRTPLGAKMQIPEI